MSIKPDYKPDKTWKARRQVRFYGFLIITLILIGLFSSLLAYISKHPPGATELTIPPVQQQPTVTPRPQPPDSQPDPAVRQPGKPKYDFYKLLPERQLNIQDNPKQGSSAPGTPAQRTVSQVSATQTKSAPQSIAGVPQGQAAVQTADTTLGSYQVENRYIIQVGSFGEQAAADQLKASIASLGVTAYIETDSEARGPPLYRVRIGPIAGVGEVNALRQLLQSNNIQSVSIKVR